jgi:hypothetical protein
MSRQLAKLLSSLSEDELRRSTPFSDDILTANRVLNYPYANDPQRAEALEDWLQGNQPCIFGRMAAKARGIDFCFLTDSDLYESDEHVQQKIQHKRLLWKRRAYKGFPTHGFMIVVCSNLVLNARPDSNLKAFANYVQSLAAWPIREDAAGNYVADEWLYLSDDKSGDVKKFVFSVDFFAAAGDGRWWHDHRIPGGIGFTTNSLGHMAALRARTGGTGSPIEWALRVAMLTISSARETQPHGPATWLLDKPGGKPIRPFNWTESDPLPELKKFPDSDHGSYAGHLHTDHAIRDEFFNGNEVPAKKRDPYLMDFKYIFDPSVPDHAPFVAGLASTVAEAEAEIGHPDDWRSIKVSDEPPSVAQPSFAVGEVNAALQACRAWRMSDATFKRLWLDS